MSIEKVSRRTLEVQDSRPRQFVRRRFLSIYLPMVFVLVLAVSGGFNLVEYQDARNDLFAKLNRITINYGILVAEPLLEGHNDQISLILAGSTDDPDLLGIGVKDRIGNILAQIGDLSTVPREDLHRIKPLHLATAEGLQEIGALYVIMDDARLVDTVYRQILLTAVLTLAIMVAALVSSLFAHRTAIGRPLNRLLAHVRDTPAGSQHQPLAPQREDEIGLLVRAFNDLQQRQSAHEQQLVRSRDELDLRVRERTADLEAARDVAESANRTKSLFLANLSHELRTPLSGIIGFSEILEKQLRGDEQHPKAADFAHDIGESGEHLLRMINNLLDMSKAEAGKLIANRRAIDIGAVLSAQVRMMRVMSENASVTVEENLPSELPEVHADPQMIRQIITNLLSNAIKFTPRGGTIIVGASQADNGGIRFWVDDTGIGIPEADRERVLRPFEQAETGLNRRYEGTGLGLPISHALVMLHDGMLEISGAPGTGTTVTVTLPPAGVSS